MHSHWDFWTLSVIVICLIVGVALEIYAQHRRRNDPEFFDDEYRVENDEISFCTREDRHDGPCNGWPQVACIDEIERSWKAASEGFPHDVDEPIAPAPPAKKPQKATRKSASKRTRKPVSKKPRKAA
jgi:hypothetical protein